jgi:thiamine-phosphate pyrophosphorylase
VTADPSGANPRARLAAARLYLVVDSAPEPHTLPDLLRAAVAGGVDLVQLRDKYLSDDELAAVANATRALCERLGVLLMVDDRPAVAAEVGADGVHIGQQDMPADAVRELVGPDMLIGLSTHSEGEIAAADPALVDYISVGPVYETTTKPGRDAVGVELVRHAAAHAPVPFFAIGGLRADNVEAVLAAGARRIAVSSAIARAEEPEAAARSLCERIGVSPAKDAG